MTRSERRIVALLDGKGWVGERNLRTTFAFLQDMALRGLIAGAMRTSGGSPDDRVWRKVEKP